MNIDELRKQVKAELEALTSHEVAHQRAVIHAMLAVLGSLNQNLSGPITFPPSGSSNQTTASIECPKCGYVATATLK